MTAITSDAISAMRAAEGEWLGSASTGNRAFRVSSMNDWQVRALQKIASLGFLNENWNSYGSESLSDITIDTMINIVRSIAIDDLPTPRVVPISGGGIQLEWEKGARELELELHPDLTVEILRSENDEPLNNGELLRSAADVERLLHWLDAA